MNQLHIVLHWYEDYPSEYKARRYRALPWVKKDGMRHLYYQITSSISDDKVALAETF